MRRYSAEQGTGARVTLSGGEGGQLGSVGGHSRHARIGSIGMAERVSLPAGPGRRPLHPGSSRIRVESRLEGRGWRGRPRRPRGIRSDPMSSPDDRIAHLPADRRPRHVGIIMDGNGRWARERGLPRERGHEKGADAVREVVRAARRIGIEALTLFAFSSQNWDRPPEEVFHLMELLRRYLFEERGEILDNDIRLTTVGDTERLPGFVREPLKELMAASAENQGMVLCLALSYGGRETITRAARRLAREVAAGKLDPEAVDVDTFASYLPSSSLPSLDLLVRTSGEHRISNFFLWESAYAELHFSPTMWPEFAREDLVRALEDYASRERRFGQTSAQVESAGASTPDEGEADADAEGGDDALTSPAREGA